MKKRAELLAPAGGEKALFAAVAAGADAVYLGADRFSARSGADNFSLGNLGKYIDYCHVRGVRVHMAANTLVKEHERADFLRYVTEAYNMGIDAVIIQDIGMAMHLRSALPGLELHASTQMTVSTPEGAKALERLGFGRIVLSRELTKDEIKEIRAATDAELEVFVHGALCWCYSGQCLMSSIIGRRSGNRGMCAQPCRLPYTVIKDGKGVKSGYPMSPRDLCLADEVRGLCDMGIDSFKIEGRLKSEQYVATTVGVYRKCIDGGAVSDGDMRALMGTFNRSGFTKGWYGGAKNFMSGASPSNMAKNEIAPEYARFVHPGEVRRVPADIYAQVKLGEPLEVTMLDRDGNAATARGSVCAESARMKALDADRLSVQLTKLGESCFYAASCEVSIDDGTALPVSEINAVRRAACALLAEQRAKKHAPAEIVCAAPSGVRGEVEEQYITAVCRTREQAMAAVAAGADRICAPESALAAVPEGAVKITLLRGVGADKADGNVMVMNTAQVGMADKCGLFGGFRLNITNSESAAVFGDFKAVCLSPELNLRDIKQLATVQNAEVIAYGKLPLMIMRRCPAKDICRGGGGYSLRDRRGEEFAIMCGRGCTSELLNSKPIYMADKLGDLRRAGINGLQLWFTDEGAKETARIISDYKNGTDKPIENFTRGHFYRGMV